MKKRALLKLTILAAITVVGLAFYTSCADPMWKTVYSVYPNGSANGKVCATPPEVQQPPVKIIFIIDDSGSNKTTDPTNCRLSATSDFITTNIDPNPELYFAIEKFTEGGQLLTNDPGNPTNFTRNTGVLFGALSSFVATGGTYYGPAIQAGKTAIERDIIFQETKAKRTGYVVVFLSDGRPYDTDSAIRAEVESLAALKDKVGFLDFYTGTYNPDASTDEFSILRDKMLNTWFNGSNPYNRGIFMDFTSPGVGCQINFDIVDTSNPFAGKWEIRSFMAYNLNFHGDGDADGDGVTEYVIDSDGDSITDAQEAIEGTSPVKADSDGDGLSDNVEIFLGANSENFDPMNPYLPPPDDFLRGCTASEKVTDTDGDWVSDCDEKNYPHDDKLFDTDVDGLVDIFEIFNNWFTCIPSDGCKNVDDRYEVDSDQDGYMNFDEIKLHTDPKAFTTQDAKEANEYKYFMTYSTNAEGNQCIDFRIENISVGETLATATHAEGINEIALFLTIYPNDMPGEMGEIRTAKALIDYNSEDRNVRIEDSEFK